MLQVVTVVLRLPETMADSLNLATISKFDGKNFQQWKFQIKCALRAKNVYDVASGVVQKPSADRTEDVSAWNKKDALAMCVITATMDLSQIVLIENCESAKQILDKLDSIYSFKSETNKMLLHEQFHQYRMSANDSVVQHISKVENLARQINEAGDQISNMAVITKILSTLPIKFRNFRQAWLSLEEGKQTIQNLTARLVDEELSLTSMETSDNALVATSSKPSQQKKNSKSRVTCYSCQKKGHFARDCRTRNSQAPQNQHKQGHKGDRHTERNQPRNGNYSAFNIDHDVIAKKLVDDKTTWILDSGASAHMSSQRELFISLKVVDEFPVKLGNNFELSVKGIGEIQIECWINGEWVKSIMTNVWYVPGLRKNLFSEGVVTKNGMKVTKENNRAEIYEDGLLKAIAVRESNNLYKLLFRTCIGEANTIAQESLKTWHDRLGHVNFKTLRNMINKEIISGVNLEDSKDFVCEGCQFGKQHKLSFGRCERRDLKPGELIHSDLCGPMSVPSVSGALYFVLFTDDNTGYRSVYFIKHKSDVLDCFRKFVEVCKNQHGYPVKVLRSDNGTEFVNRDFKQFLSSKGIQHETSAPFTQEQNGKSERENRTVVESARSMLYTKDLPLYLWAEAVNTAVYILNRTSNSRSKDTTPFELWTNRKPTLKHVRVFGSKAYMHVPDSQRTKLEPKSKKLILVGYENESTNYRLFDFTTKKVKVSRNVIFDEDTQVILPRTNAILFPLDSSNVDEDRVERNEDEENQNVHQGDNNDERIEPEERNERYSLRPKETLEKPKHLNDFELNIVETEVPETYDEAVSCSDHLQWKKAINEELEALTKNKTWEMVPFCSDKHVIGSKWVFKVKRTSSGEVDRYKARLCAQGYSQVEGIDYNETYSPTTRYDTIRTILAIAVKRKYKISQFDIKTAFLHGELSEDIYMKPPPGIVCEPNFVCQLKKALYGLKQAPRCWNVKFKNFLKNFGFKQSEADKCVFIGDFNLETVLLILYVDDGLLLAKNQDTIDIILDEMEKSFEVTVSKEINYFVGLEMKINGTDNSVFIHVSNFIDRMLKRFNLEDAKVNKVPADPNTVLSVTTDDSSISCVAFPYRQAVGSLMFAAITARPDIMYAVGLVSRFQNNPSNSHVEAVKRILKYLKATKNLGILYSSQVSDNILTGYSDADYASDVDTRRSTTGYVFKVNGGAITWCSRRQQCVSLSTTEAEFIAASEATKEAMWLKQLFADIGESTSEKLVLFVDNQSAIKLIKNPVYHKRTKHIDVRYNYVREKYEENQIDIKFVPTNDQISDIFTKALSPNKFEMFRSGLGMEYFDLL